MKTEKPPIIALAQFFDDIRMEVTGKAILIGQYAGYMVLSPGSMPVDRVAVLLTVRWPRDYTPREMGMKIDVPGQPPLVHPLPALSPPDFTNKPPSPFSGVMMQAVLHLRFAPLRIGDTIDVWFQADGHDFPAGRLSLVDQLVPNGSGPMDVPAAPIAVGM